MKKIFLLVLATLVTQKIFAPNTWKQIVEDNLDTTAYTLYFPYTILNNNLSYSDSWKSIAKKEIFSH